KSYLQKHNKISYSNHWATPKEIYDKYVNEQCYYDPCPLNDDTFTFQDIDRKIFLNPPYSEISNWINWAINEYKKFGNHIVILIPYRTDTKYFHQLLECGCDLEFIKGRLRFGDLKGTAPFPSVLVHLR